MRIRILIPGYDVPLEVDEGIYNVYIKLELLAEDVGDLLFRFSI